MKRIIIAFSVVIILIAINGCNREEIVGSNNNPVVINSKKGLYILSEGSMSVSGSSVLSFYDFDTTFYQNIFRPGNLGNAPDGMIYDGSDILITEQGNFNSAGKIYRVDTGGTVKQSQIVGTNPYSLCISNGKIYVTNGPANNVSVLDFSSLATLKTISTGIYPQEILSYNGKVFVCNTSNWGGPYDSTVNVIDASADTVISRITLKREPSSIALSRNNKILVGCYSSTGYIFTVDPSTYVILDSVSLGATGGFARDISIDKNSDNIYFISYANEICRLNLTTKIAEIVIHNSNPVSNYYYGYIFDSKRKRHYIANARTFTSSGWIHIFGFDNSLIATYSTGYAPRRLMILDN